MVLSFPLQPQGLEMFSKQLLRQLRCSHECMPLGQGIQECLKG